MKGIFEQVKSVLLSDPELVKLVQSGGDSTETIRERVPLLLAEISKRNAVLYPLGGGDWRSDTRAQMADAVMEGVWHSINTEHGS